jgi:plastocyanin
MRRGIGLATVIVSTCVMLPSATAMGAPTAGPRGAEPPADGVHVNVGDWYFDPSTPVIQRGDTIVFDFVGPTTHTATDGSGLELYDSGNVGAGGPSTWFTFNAAGVYAFVCSPHDFMGGRVSVPMRAVPATGRRHATFTLVWASAVATGDNVYDVQIRRPGSTWSTWRSGVVIRRDTFEPSKAGRYRFRARMRDVGLGESSRWSPASSISVR